MTASDLPFPRPAAPLPARPGTLARRALAAVANPAVFDFWAARVSRTWSWERPLARIVRMTPAAEDSVTLVLRANRHWRGIEPGAHVNIGAEIDGRRVTRSYSPSNVPGRNGLIELTVTRVDGGRMSRHLCEDARVGDVLTLGETFGEMRLPDTDTAPLLFLAAGSGITPLMAMLRAYALQQRKGGVTLLYWARRRGEFCFVDELRALASAHAGITVRFVLTGEAAQHADEAEGRLDVAHLADIGIDNAHVFACGPNGFVERARCLVGTRAAGFIAEAFTPPTPTEALAADATGTVDIILARSGRTLQVARGTSLLDALEAQGLRPKSGCRMGICNTCACGKASGTTRDLRTGERDAEPTAALRLCINTASTDLTLDL